jgi:polysaccharide export outer membrane protein
VDLRSENLFDSPVYYLQQNDIVYVEPNNARAGQADVSTNTWKTPTLWISIASLLSTIVVLIVK